MTLLNPNDMTSHTYPQLSKSRYLNGLQCLKRLYLQTHRSELADPMSMGQQAIFDSGTSVGELAQQRFPGGALVAEEYFEHRQAERTTRRLLSDSSTPALYEPAFSFEGIRSRIDMLRRAGGGEFDLIEVKSTTSVKDVHIPDVAVQVYMAEGAGIPIRRAYLLHIDNSYVYEGGDHDLDALFSLSDVTGRARTHVETVMPAHLEQMRESLLMPEAPDIETGRHCTTPYVCPFFGYCHRDEPEHPVRELPGLRQPVRKRLRASGIESIGDIPENHPGLSYLQRRVRDSVVSGLPFVGVPLAARLREIEFPASFLDFETISPAIPMYAGTRPYQRIPFQWSLHVRDEEGGLSHSDFLHDGNGDPREWFITSLLAAMPAQGSIVAYSSYEKSMLRELARDFPYYRGPLLALVKRVIDLLQIVRSEYYHPEFHGSFSIKSVIPALVPELAYDDLEIQEGAAASVSYAQLMAADTSQAEADKVSSALLSYCERDTEAMVRVFEGLLFEAVQLHDSS